MAGELAEELRDLYAEVYAEPPYNEGPEHVAWFVDRYAADILKPGFSLVVATAEQGLVGAAHGWTMQAGQWFSKPITKPLTVIKDSPKFAIMEWMVRRSWRGQGVGRHLLDLLLADRPEPYAILASNPEAPARRVYEHLGWTYCGSTEPGFMPSMDILAVPLAPDQS